MRAAHLDLDDRCDGDADASAWRATEVGKLARLEDVVDICVERVREQNRNLDACLVLACLSLDHSDRADGDARKLGEFLDGKTEILADLTQLVSQLFTCQSCSRSDTGRIFTIIALLMDKVNIGEVKGLSHLRRPRHNIFENQFSRVDALANVHRTFSPSPSLLEVEG